MMSEPSLNDTVHTLLDFSDSMKQKLVDVASPLTEVFDSTYFYYIRYFVTIKKRLILSTRVDCLRHFLSEKQVSAMSPMFQNVVEEVFNNNKKYYLWTGSPSDNTHQAFYEQDIWNGCTLYTKTNDIIEACGVATKRENEKIVNKYVNNFDMFSRFMLYFKESFSDLLDEPDKSILLPSNLPVPVVSQDNDEKLTDFLKKTQIKSYPVIANTRNVLITKREAEVMFYLSKGKSAKETASQLAISPRTVESYIDNVKLKLGCTTRSKAIELFQNCYGASTQILFV